MTATSAIRTRLLEVSGLGIRLASAEGPLAAVREVSLQLDRGETLGLIGESGSGKSLTALALMGLLPEGARVTGRIDFAGQDLAALDEDSWCRLRGNRVAMVFQEPMTALNPLQTVGRQIMEPMRVHTSMSRGQARREALALMERVGLPDPARRFDTYPHEMSGGQRQRVSIAMALACGPDLLIADEPTTALDVTLQAQILELIAGLVAERGMSLILISHDLGLIGEHADRLLVMYGGTVVESGPTASVFAERRHPYTQGLFAARPRLGLGRGRRLPTIRGTVPELAQLPPGCPFDGRCDWRVPHCADGLPPAVAVDLTTAHRARCVRLDELPGLQAAAAGTSAAGLGRADA